MGGQGLTETIGDQAIEVIRRHASPWLSHYSPNYPLNQKCGAAWDKDTNFYSIVSN